MSKENKFSVFLSMTEMDDELICEACGEEERRSRPGRLRLLIAAAAVLAVLALIFVLRVPGKPSLQTAVVDPSSPARTEGAVMTVPPTDGYNETEAASPSPAYPVYVTPGVLPSSGLETEAARTELPTPYPTDGITASPSLTPFETARPSAAQTPDPTAETTAPPATPTPTATAAPTPSPSAAATPTPTSEATPTNEPEPSILPQPTGIAEPEELTYFSFADFEADVRNHAHSLLEGLDIYYVPKNIGQGVVFAYICVTEGEVVVVYRAAETVWWEFGWSRVHDGSYISEIVSHYPGEWHADRYVHFASGGGPAICVWWEQYGKLFCVRVYGSTDFEAVEDFCIAVRRTV